MHLAADDWRLAGIQIAQNKTKTVIVKENTIPASPGRYCLQKIMHSFNKQ